MTRNCWKVYKLIFPNNKTYIGITSRSLEERFKNGFGYTSCPRVYAAIKKYGWGNVRHTVLKDNCTQIEAEELEKRYINEFRSTQKDNGYNISFGGNTPLSGRTHSVATRKKLSEIQKTKIGELSPHFGKKHSDATKEKMRKPHPSMQGENNHWFGVRGAQNPLYGIERTNEVKKKISDGIKFHYQVYPEKLDYLTKKIQEYQKTNGNPRSKKVRCIETGIVYNSVREASRYIGISNQCISRVLNGGRKHAGKLCDGTLLSWEWVA